MDSDGEYPRNECFIDKLPVEVLHHIFSFIPFHCFKVQTENGKAMTYHQGMLLRSVSRRFRSVANDNSYWHIDDFSCNSFIPRALCTYGTPPPISREFLGPFYRTVFSDKHLCERLSRRNEWTLDSLELVQALLSNIPSITVTTENIYLNSDLQPDLDVTMKLLSDFTNVTDLEVYGCDILMDLDKVSECFPRLKDLVVHIARYRGSLRQLAHLVTYELNMSKHDSFKPTLAFELIPVASASTLKNLIIIGCNMTDEIDYPEFVDDVRKFGNLEVINFSPLEGDLVFMVTDCTTLPINSLQAKISSYEVRSVLEGNMFATLKGIQILHLAIGDYCENDVVEYLEACSEYIRAITSTLLDLRELVLYAALDLRWATDFQSLRKLERLQWSLCPTVYEHDTCKDMPGYELFKDTPATLFKEVFRGFEKPPEVTIEISDSIAIFLG